MAFQDVFEEMPDPLGEGIVGLGIVGTRPLAGSPALQGVTVPFLDLGSGQTLPGAEAPLAEPLVDPDLEAEPAGHDLRRLPGPLQVARVNDVNLVGQLVGELPGLISPARVQGGVRVSLPAAVAVPVGLAVTHEEDGGHGARLASQWTSA